MTRKPPTPEQYAKLLTEREDLLKFKADAQRAQVAAQRRIAHTENELRNALTAKHEIARELEDTRRTVARQAEEITTLRAERAHKDDYAARLASALESAQKRGAAYEAHWRAVARLVGTELEGDYIDAGEAARIAADVAQLVANKRGTP